MPWPFVSNSGCLFSGLAWMGIIFSIVYAAVSSAVATLRKNKSFAAAVLSWTMAAVSFLLIISTMSTLADVRHELARSGVSGIGRSLADAFRYLPDYTYEGFYGYFPPTAPTNIWVQELRITAAIWLVSAVVALGLMVWRLATSRRNPVVTPRRLRPWMVMGAGGLIVVIVHLIYGFVRYGMAVAQ